MAEPVAPITLPGIFSAAQTQVQALLDAKDATIAQLEAQIVGLTPTLWGCSAIDPEKFNPQVERFYNGDPGSAIMPWPTVANNAIPIDSFKFDPEEILAGKWDATLIPYFKAAPSKAYCSYWHEPENDAIVPADYASAFHYIVELARANGRSDIRWCLILMAWTVNPASKRDYADWYPGDDVVDVMAWDGYIKNANGLPGDVYDNCIAVSQQHNKPWAVAECGVNNNITPGPARYAKLQQLSQYFAMANPRPEFVAYWNQAAFQISNDPNALNAWFAGQKPNQ